jgi:hypothetical protein
MLKGLLSRTGRILLFNYWKRRVPIPIRPGLFAGLENGRGGQKNAFIEQEITIWYSRKVIIWRIQTIDNTALA